MRNFTVQEILPKVYHLNFKTQYLLARHFIRFQEHYESPVFRDQIFSLEEFELWYMKDQNKKTFTYYKDWGGFNIPGYVISRLNSGAFNPLNQFERDLIGATPKRNDIYVIGTYGNKDKETLNHELAHALYYTNAEYKAAIDRELFQYKDALVNLKEYILELGYHSSVVEDECQAYMIGCTSIIASKNIEYSKDFETNVRNIFKRALKEEMR